MDYNEELGWDMRQQRIEFISELATTVRKLYLTAKQQNKSTDAVRDYLDGLDGLWREIRQYVQYVGDKDRKVDIDGDRRNIQDVLDACNEMLQHTNDTRPVFTMLRTVDDRINELRIAAGLDVPVEKELIFDATQ